MFKQPPPVREFIQKRQDEWQRLETLLERKQGRSPLTTDEIRELGALYRAIASDLAIARRDYPAERVTAFLNQLLTQTHSFIYQEDVSSWRNFAHYFTHTIPQTFRDTWRFTLVAFLLFLIPALIAFRLMYTTPALAQIFGLEPARRLLADQSLWTEIPPTQRPAAMSEIATNNIRVAMLAFGGGITLGLFSAYIMIGNGLHVGGVMGLAYHYGLGYELTNFVFAHGVIELSVIFIAGGAGLQIGWAVIHPGSHRRQDSLALVARRAAALVTLGILLLLGTGAIEGFLSPSGAVFAVKIAVGLGTGALVYGYLLASGRHEPNARDV